MIYKTLLVMIAVISLILPLPSTADELDDPECAFCEHPIDPADSVTVTDWQTNEKYTLRSASLQGSSAVRISYSLDQLQEVSVETRPMLDIYRSGIARSSHP